MISYQKLAEELNPHQKKMVSSWMRSISQPVRRKISNHAMGEDDTIFVPLTHRDEIEHTPVHPEVAAHLAKHNYKIASGEDYKAGYAIDPHQRQTKIGKALLRTGATTELINKFNNDPNRALKKNDHLMVAITRDPHQVAAMSTGRGWESCMTLPSDRYEDDAGSNHHYIPEELRGGTHVAYLVHKNDKKIENPIARIALKPFNKLANPDSYSNDEIDRENPHTILRPEKTSYGTDDGSLHHTVSRWCDTHFPMQEGAAYKKNPKSYDDDGLRRIARPSSKTLRDIITNERDDSLHEVLRMSSNHDVNKQAYHIADELKSPEPIMRTILRHDKTSKDIVNHYVNKSLDTLEGEHRKKWANNFIDRMYPIANKVEPHHVAAILDHADIEDGVNVQKNFIEHPGVEERHITRMLNGTANFGDVARIPRWKLTNEHISKLIDPPFEHDGPHSKKMEAMRSIATAHIYRLSASFGPEQAQQIHNKILNTDRDDLALNQYSRWTTHLDPKHSSIDTLRAVAKHVHGTDAQHISQRNVIMHPDVSVEDAKNYHESYKSAIFRPHETTETLSSILNNTKNPHAMNELLNGGKGMFKGMSAQIILGDALAKHHADGHEFASKFITHHGLDLEHPTDGIKPHHFELAKAMFEHEFDPSGVEKEHAETMQNVHSINRQNLALSVAISKSLTPEQHTEFLGRVIHHAGKDARLANSLNGIISASARSTGGKLHPNHLDRLSEPYVNMLKQERVLK